MQTVIIDTETVVVPDEHIFKPKQVVCLSSASNKYPQGVLYPTSEVEEVARTLLLSEAFIVGHNISFDMRALGHTFPELQVLIDRAYIQRRIFDTIIQARLLFIREPNRFGGSDRRYALDKQVEYWLNDETVDKKEEWRMRYGELLHKPLSEYPERAKQYATHDAYITRKLWFKLINVLGQNRPEPACARETAFDYSLSHISQHGLKVDRAEVETIREEVQRNIVRLEKECEPLFHPTLKKGKYVVNQKEIRRRVKKSYPLPKHNPTPPLSAKGNILTNEETLKLCSDPILLTYLELKQYKKLEATYLNKLEAEYVHPRYKVLGAVTGRTSCSGPNVQNLPRKGNIRSCFIPSAAHRVFIACDYSAQEMRTLGQVLLDKFGTSRLASKFQEDPYFDPHTLFAKEMAGEKWADMSKAEQKELRQKAKIANFGFAGGMGAKTLVKYAKGYGTTLTQTDADALKYHWFRTWKNMLKYFYEASKVSRMPKPIVVLERPQITKGFKKRKEEGYSCFTQVANGEFQSLASVASKNAVAVVDMATRNPSSLLFGCQIRAFIHDEIILEGDMSRRTEQAEELSRLMIKAMEDIVPDVPSVAEPSAMHRWIKEAECVREQGEIKVFGTPYYSDHTKGKDDDTFSWTF